MIARSERTKDPTGVGKKNNDLELLARITGSSSRGFEETSARPPLPAHQGGPTKNGGTVCSHHLRSRCHMRCPLHKNQPFGAAACLACAFERGRAAATADLLTIATLALTRLQAAQSADVDIERPFLPPPAVGDGETGDNE